MARPSLETEYKTFEAAQNERLFLLVCLLVMKAERGKIDTMSDIFYCVKQALCG